MGFFSSTEPLQEAFQEALDPCYTESNVGRKYYKVGLSKLGASQSGITAALNQGERLINIAPSVTDGLGYSGHLVLTNQRVFDYKGKVRGSIRLVDVADVEMGAHPGGYVVTSVISKTAKTYEAFQNQTSTDAGMKYWNNIIQTYLNDAKLAQHAAALIMGEASRA